jgi:hypothetical protein
VNGKTSICPSGCLSIKLLIISKAGAFTGALRAEGLGLSHSQAPGAARSSVATAP